MIRWRLLIANLALAFMLFGGYWGRTIEDAQIGSADLFSSLDLRFRGWKTKDRKLDVSELSLLQPDAYLVRRYTAPDESYVELAIIAGHKKRTVHNPGFCMIGGGWEMLSQRERQLELGSLTVPIVRSTIGKGERRLMATYFYSDGSVHTTSPLHFTWIQLVKRFRTEIPMGALVRIIVPLDDEEEPAEALSTEFANSVLPTILQALRSARMKVGS